MAEDVLVLVGEGEVGWRVWVEECATRAVLEVKDGEWKVS